MLVNDFGSSNIGGNLVGGVVEPSEIAATFMDQGLRDRSRLDSLMCLMDASQIFAAPEMMKLKLLQIAYADMLILNKFDLASREEIARLKAWLDERFRRYRLVEATCGEAPLEILLSAGRFDPAHPDRRHRRVRTDGWCWAAGEVCGLYRQPPNPRRATLKRAAAILR